MLFISILNLIGQKAGTLLNISLYSQLQLNTVLGNSSIHYGSYTWDLTFGEQVRFGVNEGRIKYQDFFLIVFVIYTIIIWGRQQIWKLRLWELTQLAQDDQLLSANEIHIWLFLLHYVLDANVNQWMSEFEKDLELSSELLLFIYLPLYSQTLAQCWLHRKSSINIYCWMNK